MNLEAVTIQDCLDMQCKKKMNTILVAGHVVGFEEGREPDNEATQTKSIPARVGDSGGG